MSEFNFTKVAFGIICLACGCAAAQLMGFEVPTDSALVCAAAALTLSVPVALAGIFGWEVVASAGALISVTTGALAYVNAFVAGIGIPDEIKAILLVPMNAFVFIGFQKYLTRQGG
ncbi:MAG: hypothetical protein ABC596_09040 [Candidatus Methanosuratincola petrocarbonis]